MINGQRATATMSRVPVECRLIDMAGNLHVCRFGSCIEARTLKSITNFSSPRLNKFKTKTMKMVKKVAEGLREGNGVRWGARKSSGQVVLAQGRPTRSRANLNHLISIDLTSERR